MTRSPQRSAPPFRREAVLGAVTLAALAVSFIFLWSTARRYETAVRDGRELLRLTREVRYLAGDRQVALRGFAMSQRNDAFLDLEREARSELPMKLDSLSQRSGGEPENRRLFARLSTAVARWDSLYATPVAAGRLDASVAELASRDKILFDPVREAADDYLQHQEAAYMRAASRADRFRLLMLGVVFLEILIIGWTIRRLYTAARRQALELLEKQATLEEQAAELEQQIDEAQSLAEDLSHANASLLAENASRRLAEEAHSAESSERKRLEEQLLHSQKMEAIGRLAGGVAHDFNNLLTVILSYATLAGNRLPSGDILRQDLQEIEDAARRAAALTAQLLAFSRKQVLQPQLLDLNQVVESFEKMMRRVIGEDIELIITSRTGLGSVYADRSQLEQVLMNLAINARDAMPRGGRLLIETSEQDLTDDHAGRVVGAGAGRYVVLSVSDTGVGMSPEARERAFEPFFTTKPVGQGTGLGLSTVYGIVKQSGGDIWVYSEEGHGTTFRIYLPVAAPDVQPRPTAADGTRHATGNETVLLVEDDPALRPLTRRILTEGGYNVLTAANGLEALAISREYPERIHLVLSDVVMPRVSGRVLAEQMLEERPGVKVLLMSGYTDDDLMRRGVSMASTTFLQKPFAPAELMAKVRETLDS